MSEKMYLLKVRLLEIESIIWRDFVVPSEITLDRLHDVIQIVMGWADSHMHHFNINKKLYTENPEEEEDGFEDGKYRLGDLVKKTEEAIMYFYDFGDRWDHELILLDKNYVNSNLQSAIVCLDGARACPPENVGSVDGYYKFCEAMKNPKHEEHERLITWHGGYYDSEHFDIQQINRELSKYLRWSRNRYQLFLP